ncbi:hypothetical protein Tco_0684097 [Tanacetum coccineum]
MLFSNGDDVFVTTLKNAIDEFSKVSGLVPNLDKSVTFFGNVPSHTKRAILRVMAFAEGSLPIRYLGVPLISSRLYKKFCDPLIDKLKQSFWSSVFILPDSMSLDIERIMRGFLWSHGDLQKGKSKVRWDDVCRLKIQGGLGIKSLQSWNVALMCEYVWNLVSQKDSFWVKWINSYKLVDIRSCERNF